MRIGIVGCGVIGARRAHSLPQGSSVTAVFDLHADRAETLAKSLGATAFLNLEDFCRSGLIDAVFVSTINAALVPTSQACLDAGFHVLVEKPAARSCRELKTLRIPAQTIFKVGFNHRFHPAFDDLKKLLADSARANADDPILYVNARYGNGARLGFDKEWRSKVELSGGGELLDQGVHLLDLALQVLPGLKVLSGLSRTQYWQMPVDDNTWAWLSNAKSQTFTMHVSSSEWKNEFLFEVYTRKRKFRWQGLGRSYGLETLTIYTMKEEMGPPLEERREYPAEDKSWLRENTNFVNAIQGLESVEGGLEDAQTVLNLVDQIYVKSRALQEASPQHPRWREKE